MNRKQLEQEVRELRSALLGRIEREQKVAERERRRKADLLDAVLLVAERKRKANAAGDDLSVLIDALDAYLS